MTAGRRHRLGERAFVRFQQVRRPESAQVVAEEPTHASLSRDSNGSLRTISRSATRKVTGPHTSFSFDVEELTMHLLKCPALVLAVVAILLALGCAGADESASAEVDSAIKKHARELLLASPSIKPGEPMPDEFTCDARAFGDGTSPELGWSNEPKGTKSYAILLKDQTIEAGESAADQNPEHPFHWAIWNIKDSVHTLPASLSTAQFPLKGAQQQNGAPPFISPGPYGYFGPCPNLGVAAFGAAAEVHDDAFILYAFKDTTLAPPPYDPGPDSANPLNPVRQLASFFESHQSLLGKAALKFTSDATPSTCPGFPNPPFACASPSPP